MSNLTLNTIKYKYLINKVLFFLRIFSMSLNQLKHKSYESFLNIFFIISPLTKIACNSCVVVRQDVKLNETPHTENIRCKEKI